MIASGTPSSQLAALAADSLSVFSSTHPQIPVSSEEHGSSVDVAMTAMLAMLAEPGASDWCQRAGEEHVAGIARSGGIDGDEHAGAEA